MSISGEYIAEIKELIKEMGLREVANALSTTERGVLYWIADTDPKIPRRETIKKIHELFMNRKTGQPQAPSKPREPDQSNLVDIIANLAAGNKKIGESNADLALSNRKLTSLTEKAEHGFSEKLADQIATIAALQDFVVANAVRLELFANLSEAQKAFRKLKDGYLKKNKKQEGIHDGVDS